LNFMKNQYKSNNGVFHVILAGGQSSRLFPFNKVLSGLNGSGRSLIQQAADRFGTQARNCYVLTVSRHGVTHTKPAEINIEPYFCRPRQARDLAGHIVGYDTFAGSKIPKRLMAIVTADHVIQGDKAFQKSFREAVETAERKSGIVMLGIPPNNDPKEWQGFVVFERRPMGASSSLRKNPRRIARHK